MFTVDAEMGTDLAQTNYDFEYHLIHGILYNYPSFKFAKVNANDPAYVNLVKSWGISVADLYNSPSVLISEDQRGEWIHGDRKYEQRRQFLVENSKCKWQWRILMYEERLW